MTKNADDENAIVNYDMVAKIRLNAAQEWSQRINPTFDRAVRYSELSNGWGKLFVTQAFLLNAGALAGIVVLHQVFRDDNPGWMKEAFWPAVLFCLGLGSAAICAVCGWLSYGSHAAYWYAAGHDVALHAAHEHFDANPKETGPEVDRLSATIQRTTDQVVRALPRYTWGGIVSGLLAYVAVAVGAAMLLLSINAGPHGRTATPPPVPIASPPAPAAAPSSPVLPPSAPPARAP